MNKAKFTDLMMDLNSVRIIAAGLVFITVALALFMGEVINRDGIVYVTTAQAFLDGGVKAAMAVYNWPAYSILFALISKWTGLSLETSAHLLNTVFVLLLVDSFIRLSNELDTTESHPWLAALVILSFPPLDHRLEIYRDWGYIGFSLFALVPLIKFWKSSKTGAPDAFIWQIYMMIALLFRVEAIALILLAPVSLLLQKMPWKLRIKRYLSANALVIASTACGALIILITDIPLGKLSDITRYTDPEYVFGTFNQAANNLSEHVLNKYSNDYAKLILAGGISFMVAWMTLDNLGGFLVALTTIGFFRYRQSLSANYNFIYWTLIVLIFILIVFLSTRLITVSRYALLASILLLAITSRYVSLSYIERNNNKLNKYWWWFLLFGLLVGNLANLGSLPDYKEYQRQGGYWIKNNIPTNIPVITNDFVIDYYAQRPSKEKLDSKDKIIHALNFTTPPYYAAIKVNDKDRNFLIENIKAQPLKEFHSNRASESLLIFKVD